MKTKLCADHIEELASYVAESDSLSKEAAGHLRECVDCRQKVAELKQVAAKCRDEALCIPEPRTRLHRAALERAMASEGGQSRLPWWRLVLAGGAVVIAIAISVNRKSPEVIGAASPLNPSKEVPAEEAAKAPTMLALRHDLQGGREQTLALSPAGNGISHYRVRDVERELR